MTKTGSTSSGGAAGISPCRGIRWEFPSAAKGLGRFCPLSRCSARYPWRHLMMVSCGSRIEEVRCDRATKESRPQAAMKSVVKAAQAVPNPISRRWISRVGQRRSRRREPAPKRRRSGKHRRASTFRRSRETEKFSRRIGHGEESNRRTAPRRPSWRNATTFVVGPRDPDKAGSSRELALS
jgi:hypothetical protein